MIRQLVNSMFGQKKVFSGMQAVSDILDYVDSHDLYPDNRIITSAVESEAIIDGRKVLVFSSNSYLGLSTHPNLKEAAKKAIDKYGIGSTGSRLVTGNIDINLELEKRLAKFKHGEDAIVFSMGFAASMGAVAGLMNPLKVKLGSFFGRKGVILSDELNHASIVDGIKLSGQDKAIYRHCDMEHLETLLKKHKNRRKLIVTDSVFSMDGDIAPVDKISQLAKKYNALTMIDEAHAAGVIGKNGGGAMEYFNLKPTEDITMVMGTMSKSFGCIGGYVVGSRELIRYLRVAGRSYMFSAALPPAISAGAIAAIDLMEKDSSFRDKLWDNINYAKNGFEKLGLKIMKSDSAIIPVMIGEDEVAIKFARQLFDKGIFAPCVRWPVVPRKQSRIRLCISASHSKEQIDSMLKAFKEVGTILELIK